MSEVEIDCLEYVTGSVARNFISKYPNLGESNDNMVGPNCFWTEQMSKGNLIKPSNDMMNTAKILEVVFNEYHSKNNLKKHQVCTNL